MAHREPPRDALGDPAEVATHALADRLQGLEARGAGGSVDADTFGRAVIDGDEHGGEPFAGPGGGQRRKPRKSGLARPHQFAKSKAAGFLAVRGLGV